MRRKSVFRLALCQLFIFSISLIFVTAHAGLDAPHEGTANGIGCLSCHQMTSTYPKLLPPLHHTPVAGDLDDTAANNLCWSCHNDPMPLSCRDCHTSSSAPLVFTHSSQTTSSRYGTWTVECWVCHNQHIQEQNRYNGSTYGKYIRRTINLANIKGGDGNTLGKSGIKTVKFLGQTDTNSFADANGTYDGICEVCHTRTNHHRNSGDGDHEHYKGQNCIPCHNHTNGFVHGGGGGGAVCTDCHDTMVDHDHRVPPSPSAGCAACHAAADQQEIDALHGSCVRCHGYNGDRLDKNKVAQVITDGKNGIDQMCTDCHGQVDHKQDHDFALINKPSCQRCHLANVVEEHVDRRGMTCGTCHGINIRSVVDTIAEGRSNQVVLCDSCHHDPSDPTNGIGDLYEGHHATTYSIAGECTYCHVVGPGANAPRQLPCSGCHGQGKMFDPQRTGINKHAHGPAIISVQDARVCFSCHLIDGQGYVSGVTPAITPLHALPTSLPLPYLNRDNIEQDLPDYPGKGSVSIHFAEQFANGNADTPINDWYTGAGTHIRAIAFNKPDVPHTRVPITRDGATYFVPALESSGGGGKPTQTGSLQVTVAPAEAIAAGAQWRVDGTGWLDSGAPATAGLTTRVHLVEGKLIPGWASPPAVPVTITAGSTTQLTLNYEQCASGPPLSITRTSGNTTGTFTWDSEYQTESFTVAGNLPSWDVDWSLDTGSATGFTVVSTGGSSSRIEKNGTTSAGTYSFVLTAMASSCPGSVATFPMTVTVKGSGTLDPTPSAYYGTISKPLLDSLPIASSNNPRGIGVFHLAGNLYGAAYADNTATANLMLKTFQVDADGTITDVAGGSFNAGAAVGAGTVATARLSDTVVAIMYYAGTTTISLKTFSITNNGTTFTAVGSMPVDTAAISNKSLKIRNISGSVYALLYSGKAIKTVSIDTAGNINPTAISTRNPVYSGIGTDIEHVAGNWYTILVAKDGKSRVMTFTIDAAGTVNIPTAAAYFVDYQGSDATVENGDIKRVAPNIFALTYKTTYRNWKSGMIKTVKINNDGTIVQKVINQRRIDGLNSTGYDLLTITDNVVAVRHGIYSLYANNYKNIGFIRTFSISNEGWIEPAAIDEISMVDIGLNNFNAFDLLHVTGDVYVFGIDGALTINGINTVKILTAPSLPLDASLTYSANTNCGEMSFTVTVQPGAHTGPYYCDFNWGDTSSDSNIPCDAPVTHTFIGTGTTADVTWTVRNNDGYALRPATKTLQVEINRDQDGDGLCGTDPCPNDPYNDEDGDGYCGSLYAYIVSSNDKIAKIQVSDGTLKEIIAIGGSGYGVAVSPDNSKVYSTDYYANGSILDTSTKTYSPLAAPGGAYGVAVSHDNIFVYVASLSNVTVYDAATMGVIATIPVGSYARGIAASPDGARVYATKDNGTVVVIRTSDFTVTDTIPISSGGYDIAVSPDSRYVYVSNSTLSKVTIIRVADKFVETVNVGSGPRGLAPTPDGTYLYVANSSSNSVSAIRLSDKALTSIPGITQPYGVAVTPDGSQVYVTSLTPDTVSIINTGTNTVTKSIPLGTGGSLLARGRFISAANPFIPNPDIVVSDSVTPAGDLAINFGQVQGGYSTPPQTITIANQGTADLLLGTLGTTDPLGSEITLLQDNCSGRTIQPEADCTIELNFTPPATGTPTTYEDSFDIPSNDPDQGSITFSVSGTSIYAHPPDQPVNTTPADGTTVWPRPTLSASIFADTDAGDNQQASQWQVSTASGPGFTTGKVYDSGVVDAGNTHIVAGDLSFFTTYYWRVRYQDSNGFWSPYSNETSFTTETYYSLFTNRRTITVSPSTPVADYQVKITLTTANFNYAKVKANGSDLRFYDSANTQLSYWIESWNPVGTSTIWVKVPTAGTSIIYLAYGNAALSSASSGPSTFAMYFANVASGGSMTPDLQNSSGFIIEASLVASALQSEGPQINFDRTGNGNEWTNIDYLKSGNSLRRFDYSSTGVVSNSQNTPYSFMLNTATRWKIVVKQDTSNSYWFYVDNILMLSGTNLPYTHGGIWFGGWSTGDSGIFHYVFVRKYAAVEPVTSVVAEQ